MGTDGENHARREERSPWEGLSWRLLLAPWPTLTREEQEQAIREAERRGRHASRADGGRAYWEGSRDPWRPPRPNDYPLATTWGAPAGPARDWRRRCAACLVTDPRVCAFARAWERERRAALGLRPPPTDRRSLAHAARVAHEARGRAAAEHAERRRAVEAAGALPVEHPLRLALGQARAALCRAEDEYWLWRMLAGGKG